MLYDAAKSPSPADNFLLSVLPAGEFKKVRPYLVPVELVVGTVYADVCDSLRDCYFPVSGMMSLLSVTESGNACEVGYVGYEGIVGLSVVFGKNEMPYQVLVQAPSEGFRLPVSVVADLFARDRNFHDASLRFMYVMHRQFAQTSACNRFHEVPSRLCRWLAILCERAESRHLSLTQEFLAYMLGVQRTTVGAVANDLQQQEIIRYSRGKIEILDLRRLNASACECLPLINNELASFIADKNLSSMSRTRQTSVRR